MELVLDEPINTKQLLNQIESVINDVSNLKEKHTSSVEEYKKIKEIIEQLQCKTKEVKLQLDSFKEDDGSVNYQTQNLAIENVNKKIEQYKTDFEQLKKGKLSHHVS